MTKIEKWANDLQDRIDHAEPWGLTFYNGGKSMDSPISQPINGIQQKELEDYLQYHFKLWANSWIQPIINEMKKPKASR